MQVILYHNQSGEGAFNGTLKKKEVHKAITLHPIKEPESMYRLHRYIQTLNIQKHRENKIDFHRAIATSLSMMDASKLKVPYNEIFKQAPNSSKWQTNSFEDTKFLGSAHGLNRYRPNTMDEVLEWELFTKNLHTHKDFNPRRRIGSTMKEGLNDIVRETMELINVNSKERGRIIDFKDIRYGYWRLDPVYGVDIILDLLLVYRKYRGHRVTMHVRKHAYIQTTFIDTAIREIPLKANALTNTYDFSLKTLFNLFKTRLLPIFGKNLEHENYNNTTMIHFIVPLSGRLDSLKRFLHNFENICIKHNEAATLNIILYRQSEVFTESKTYVEKMRQKYAKNQMIQLFIVNGSFARAMALNTGSKQLSNNDLMLFIDVDIAFDRTSLQRIRDNTKRNASLYFPIIYSLYSPTFTNKSVEFWTKESFSSLFLVNEENGFWRQFGFGIVSIYKADYIALGGLNLNISGWGFEDVTFYDTAIKSNLLIFRSPDSGLVHMYHSINCDNSLLPAQKIMCQGTMMSTLGSLNQLQEYILKRNLLN